MGSMPVHPERLLIGISPRILRDPPGRLGFAGKTLQYLEQSVAHWVMSLGHLVVMVPTVERKSIIRRSQIDVADYAAALDGLILQGGADIHPSVYGEEPMPTLGPVDAVRDTFELELLRAFVAAKKPIFGICRGLQLINVAHGGTLYQDLQHDGVAKHPHTTEAYDGHAHDLTFAPNSWLGALYRDTGPLRVNSIHHQGIKRVGENLSVEAYSDDGVIEAVRGTGDSFILGVQWHPEFHTTDSQGAGDTALLPPDPLMEAFFNAASVRRRAVTV
jgi:putative glutamine amidotransferase